MSRLRITVAGCVLAVSVACSASDPGITTAVKTKLTADDVVKAYQVDVDTREGVVTLTGSVDSSIAKTRAVELARATDGVKDIVDNIVVEERSVAADDYAPAAMTGDAGVTAAIKTKLLADTRVSGFAIDVDTKDGVVSLSGRVSTAAQKAAALEIARATDNVRGVTDKITVAP
jgi:hyperosmotically inducible protein